MTVGYTYIEMLEMLAKVISFRIKILAFSYKMLHTSLCFA